MASRQSFAEDALTSRNFGDRLFMSNESWVAHTDMNHVNKQNRGRIAIMAYDPKKDYSFEDVPELIGYLKRSAIDAYMMSESSGITDTCTIMDDKYVVSFPMPYVGSADKDIARPGKDGRGGGKVLSSDGNEDDSDYTAQFDAIRQNIDEILKPWMTLPDSKSIGTQIEKWITVVSELAKEPAVFDPMNGRSTGSGTIFSNLTFAGTSIAHMSGAVIDKVKIFLANLQQVVEGLHSQIMFWGGTLYTEMRIFDKARSSLVDALKQGIKVFDAIASSGGAGVKWPSKSFRPQSMFS